MYSMNRGKGSPRLSVEDFIPKMTQPKPRQSPEEMLRIFRAATDKRKDT